MHGPIEHPLRAWRKVIPLTRKGDTIGRATSGTFSPLLKRLTNKHLSASQKLSRSINYLHTPLVSVLRAVLLGRQHLCATTAITKQQILA